MDPSWCKVSSQAQDPRRVAIRKGIVRAQEKRGKEGERKRNGGVRAQHERGRVTKTGNAGAVGRRNRMIWYEMRRDWMNAMATASTA
jgi:hypothetical protein